MQHFDFAVVTFGLPLLMAGLKNTILFCAISIAIGLVLGLVIALMRLSSLRLFYWPATSLVEVMRDTPFLVLIFLVFVALPSLGLALDPATLGIISLTIYGGALFSESIRGAMNSVPRGQMAAARAVGMPYLLAVRRIVFPQMWGYLLPALTNQIIGQIKNSSLLSILGVPELTQASSVVVGETFSPTETYLMVALIYWGLSALLSAAAMYLERRLTSRRTVKVLHVRDLDVRAMVR